jgi:WD40 repeat protein
MPRLSRPRPTVRLQTIGSFQLDEYINDVTFSPDGRRLAVGDASGQVVAWDVALRRCVSRAGGHQGAVLAMGWHPEGRVLGTGGEDGVGRIWDMETAEELAVLPVGERQAWVEHLAWEPGGRRLAMTAGKALQIVKWADQRGCHVEAEQTGHSSTISDMCWRKGYPGEIISSCFGAARLWAIGGEQPLKTFSYDGALLAVSLSPDGHYLASGNLDGSVHLWSTTTNQHWHMAGYPCKVRHVAFDSQGMFLWTVAGPDLVAWSATKFEGTSGRLFRGHLGWIQGMACHPSRAIVATVGEDGLLCLWHPRTTKPILSQELNVSGGLSCVAWSPNDVCLATGTDDGTVSIFSVEGAGE